MSTSLIDQSRIQALQHQMQAVMADLKKLTDAMNVAITDGTQRIEAVVKEVQEIARRIHQCEREINLVKARASRKHKSEAD